MDSDRERWDNLHAQSTKRGDASAFLQIIFREFAALLKPGRALDIACGTGRNAIFLAERGWQVDAIDISPVALTKLDAEAKSEGLSIVTQQADLHTAELPRNTYDLIINLRFLERSLLPPLAQSIKPEGYLIFETFLIDQQQVGHPTNPDYLLYHNELLDRFRELRVLFYREGAFSDEGSPEYRAGLFAQRSRSK